MHKFLDSMPKTNNKNWWDLLSNQKDIDSNNILTKNIRENKFFGVYLMLGRKLSKEDSNKLQKILIKDASDTKEYILINAFNSILTLRDDFYSN